MGAVLKRGSNGRLVAHSDTVVTDEMMYALIDADRAEPEVATRGTQTQVPQGSADSS